ncbi:hypothetical protein ACFLZW_03550 [Chloroflexota bacterium]
MAEAGGAAAVLVAEGMLFTGNGVNTVGNVALESGGEDGKELSAVGVCSLFPALLPQAVKINPKTIPI